MSLEHELEAFTDYCTDKWNWFKRLPCTVKRAKYNRKAKQYNIYGNSKQEYITIDGVQYKIPDGYTLLESVTIPTNAGISFPSTDLYQKWTFDIQFTTSTSRTLMGYGTSQGQYFGKDASNLLECGTGSTINVDATQRHVVVMDNTNGTDEVLSSEGLSVTRSNISTTTITEFAPLGSFFSAPITIYSAKCDNQDGTKYGRYYPMKNSSDVVGFYDFITNTFITPTSGTLSAGLEAPTPSQPVDIVSVGDKTYDIPYDLYTPVEYIESDGSQYINANYYISSTDTIETVVNWTSLTTNISFGVGTSSTWTSGKYIGFTYYSAAYKTFYNRGSSATGTSDTTRFSVTANTDYKISWKPSSNKFYLNGTEYTGQGGYSQTTDEFTISEYPLYIFCKNSAGTALTSDNIKIKQYFKITDANGVVKLNLIPCYRNSDSKPGMFDTVTQTFFTNANTSASTDFTYGSARTDLYKIPVIAGSNCGYVDLGSLNWTYLSSNEIFWSDITTLHPVTSGTYVNNYCSSYTTVQKQYPSLANNEISVVMNTTYNFTRIYIKDTSYTNTTAFKQAMSGVYLYYQRTDDDTWTVPTTTNCYLSEPLRKVGNYIDKIHFGTGNNLIDINTIYSDTTKFTIDGDTVSGTASRFHAQQIDLSPYIGKTITISAWLKKTSATTSTRIFAKINGSSVYGTPIVTENDIFIKNIVTVTPSTTSDYFCITYGSGVSTIWVKQLQLEKGSTATEYHPYSDTPQVIRNVGSYTFDGTETWTQIGSDPAYYSDITEIQNTVLKPASISTKVVGLSEFLPIESYADVDNGLKIGFAIISTNGRSVIPTSTYDTVSSITGKDFVYALATPTSEVISLPTLTPVKGTTIYTVPTKVQPFVSVNLFDKDNTTNVLLNAYINGQGVVISAGTNKLHYIEAKPNTTYTFSSGIAATFINGRLAYFAEIPAVGSTGTVVSASALGSIWTSTFTTASDTKYIAFHYGDLTYNISSIQIQEGSSATTYEPYCNGMEIQASTNK